MVLLLRCFGVVLVLFWCCFGVILVLLWCYFDVVLVKHNRYLRVYGHHHEPCCELVRGFAAEKVEDERVGQVFEMANGSEGSAAGRPQIFDVRVGKQLCLS